MSEYVQGGPVKSWKALHESIKEGDKIFILWHDGYRLCRIISLLPKKIVVKTPNRGIMEIESTKSMLFAIPTKKKIELIKKYK